MTESQKSRTEGATLAQHRVLGGNLGIKMELEEIIENLTNLPERVHVGRATELLAAIDEINAVHKSFSPFWNNGKQVKRGGAILNRLMSPHGYNTFSVNMFENGEQHKHVILLSEAEQKRLGVG